MFEHFTNTAIAVIMQAQEEARRLGHNFVGSEQLLLGIIKENTSIAAKVLDEFGINLANARTEVESIIGRGSGNGPVEQVKGPTASAKEKAAPRLRNAALLTCCAEIRQLR